MEITIVVADVLNVSERFPVASRGVCVNPVPVPQVTVQGVRGTAEVSYEQNLL